MHNQQLLPKFFNNLPDTQKNDIDIDNLCGHKKNSKKNLLSSY
jgi:hypothetical protein